MDLRKIKALIEAVTEGDIDELEVESKEGTVRIRRNRPSEAGSTPYVVMPNPALTARETPPALAAPAEEAAAPFSPPAAESGGTASDVDADDEVVVVTSPIVGTFYESSSPDASPFVQVGDTVKAGQVLCIIEAMKLMNEIETEVGGVVAKRFVSNAQPVEFGERLFAVKPGA